MSGAQSSSLAPPTLADAALKRAPSRGALAVMAAAVQPGSRVRTIRRLRGGISSGMHSVELVGADDARSWVVVRRFGAWRLQNFPQAAEQEWAALTALARVGAPTPQPLWLDADGAVFGCPTIVTSRMPGSGLLAPRDLDGWVRQLAEALASVHAAPLDEDELGLLADQRDEIARLVERDGAPEIIADKPLGPEVWAAMRRWWPRIRPPEPTLVHGDFWPGNILWRYGRLTGVVDWEQVRRGDPTQDVGCCRLDLTLLFGPATADTFVREYEAASGRISRHLFFWELFIASMAIENVEHWIEGYHDLGRIDVTAEEAQARLERFVTEALARAADAESGGG
jgi:aminoglycoside phosphotransferase (APT) family kinase protein